MLILATIAGAIEDFILPFIYHCRHLGWHVDGVALDITSNSACVAALNSVWDVPWSRNPLDPHNFITAVPRIQKIVIQGDYDLVHVHTPVAAFVTRYAIAQLKIKQKPQVIYTAHGFHFHQQGNPLTNLLFLNLERLAGRWTDYLITINRPEIQLAFAGDGNTRPEREQLAQKLDLQQQVHFLGFRHDIPALICSSTALLLTSGREGLPRSIMEAFCAATPVIGTKIRGIQDLLTDDCGLLVEMGNIEALSQAIAQMIDHPQQAAQMGANGRHKVVTYDVHNIIEQYTQIYHQALVRKTSTN